MNILSLWVWFTVLKFYYEKNNNSNIERIIKEIPKNYASRPTIFKLIDNAVDKKYFVKSINPDDKRKINIIPTDITIKEFEEWSRMFKGF
ncbi:MarR family winged helix-turn-helix transcriptional regulator [Alphaproteobacteria bacterium]|nr:MarR family winged helix-turn-helix transcriptional regulator [Alphaproteobacteria bacterium]